MGGAQLDKITGNSCKT